MVRQLFVSPRLRLPDENRDRHTTWLETFYDLVFVVAISALSNRLSSNISPLGFLQFLGLFLPVGWAWLGHTVYDTRFDTDDLFQRICTLGMMLAAAGMAIAIPRAFAADANAFAVSYVIARLCLLVLYLRAYWRVNETRAVTRLYLIGFSIGVSLWIISIFVPPLVRYGFWAVGLFIDLAVPWIGRGVLKDVPLDTSHLPERLGLFTIIILGEIVSVIVQNVAGSRFESIPLLMAVLAFYLTVCIWWVYFTFLDAAPFVPNLGSGQPYIYTHYPLVIGLTMIGVGIGHALVEARQPMLHLSTRWILGSGIVLWLASGLLLKRMSIGHQLSSVVIWRFIGSIACVVILMIVAGSFPPLLIFFGLIGVMSVFVFFDVRHWLLWMKHAEKANKRASQ